MDDLHARRASSFGSVAAEYALHRPDYPDQAVAWALASLRDGAPKDDPKDDRVLDLGAGTGKLTAAILRCGVPATRVLAVEPDDGMRTELSRRLPEIAVVCGSAEQIPAEDGAVDAVLVRAGVPLVRSRPGASGDRPSIATGRRVGRDRQHRG